MPIRKMTRAIPNMAAGEVKVKCISAGQIWSSSFKQFTFVKLSVVFCPEALIGGVDALSVGLANSPVQHMVYFWILSVSDSSAEIT